jgi:peptidyl-prolyl cis-trans isomerase D
MFDLVHNNKKLIQIVLAIIILPFAFWGVDSYNRAGKTVDVAATVDGAKISQQEFNNALRQQQDRLRQMLGDKFDAAMLDNPEMQRAVLDNLIAQRLLVVRAKSAGLGVTDEQVAQVIGSIEAFRNNGAFDKARYESALASQNMSPLMFEARLRDELLGQQVQEAYAQNGFTSNNVADNIIRLNEQQRVVSISPISFQPFMAQVKVDEAEVKKYYEQNSKEFQMQEQARVEYVKFSINDLQSRVEVSAEEARQYYDSHQTDFGTPEERRAAHILIGVSATAPQAEQAAAKAKAEQALGQVKQNPGRFAELAKQNSQDPGSAANGGDLGFFGHGMMVKPFDDAVFSLKADEISGLVKSDFGYHIIKLLAIKPSRVLPFDEAREGVVNKLRRQKATDKFAELAEKFSNAVYEQSDTLKPAADLAGTKIEQSGWLVKGKAEAAPWTEKMLQAIFSEDVAKNKRNTAAIEVEPDTLAAARVLEYKPASVLPLNEAQDEIRKKLQHQQALELAAKQGKAKLTELQAGDKPALIWEPALNITRARHGSLDAALVRQIFQTSATGLPQYVGAEMAQLGYMLVRIDAVKEGEAIDGAKRAGYMQQLRQLTGEEMFQAYLKDAKQQAKINVSLPEKAAAQP